MNNSIEELSSMDALLLLRKLDEEEEASSHRVSEGQQFSLATAQSTEQAREAFEQAMDSDTELEVIDVNADAVDHLASKDSYIGQGILRCNRCKSSRFVNMDELVQSQDDPEVYNVEDECPHCHGESGYELIGQVGKVPTDDVEEVSTEETEATFDNDEAAAQEDDKLEGDSSEVNAEEDEVDADSTGSKEEENAEVPAEDSSDEIDDFSFEDDDTADLEDVSSKDDQVEPDEDELDFEFDFDDEDSTEISDNDESKAEKKEKKESVRQKFRERAKLIESIERRKKLLNSVHSRMDFKRIRKDR